MSRVGKAPIPLPSGVQVTVQDSLVRVKGPRGELTRTLNPGIHVLQEDGRLVVTRENEEKKTKALHGLTRSLINNMVVGVKDGYQKSLEIVGVGYRATQQGENIALQVGFSGPVEMRPPPGIEFQVEGQNRVHVRGIEKDLVGLMAAKIRRVRPPNRYKGKGIRYVGEQVTLKAGKGGRKG